MSTHPQAPSTPGARSRRARVTRTSVRVAERLARGLITVGGIATILAVTLIMVFLIWVVLPLFQSSELGDAKLQQLALDGEQVRQVAHLETDEYRVLAWTLQRGGALDLFRLDTGERLERRELFPGEAPSAISSSAESGQVLFAFADGRLVPVRVGFSTRFLSPEEAVPELANLAAGEVRTFGDARGASGLVERTLEGELRFQALSVVVGEPLAIASGDPVTLLDRAETSTGSMFGLVRQSGALELVHGRKKTNMLTGQSTLTLSTVDIPYQRPEAAIGNPSALALSGAGDNLYLVWRDGSFLRFDLRNPKQPALAQAGDFLLEPECELTAFSQLIGRSTLLVGDNLGRTTSWFRVKPEGTDTVDGASLVQVSRFDGPAHAVRSLSPSQRSRMFCAGYADGSARIFYATSGELRAELASLREEALQVLTMSPKEDGVSALSSSGLTSWSFRAGHAEAGVRALFAPVWYEGYDKPDLVWQSSSGTDDFEPKFSLVPLIFGTLKATLYSMLFGVPIALLAALYTSEFMKPSLRSPIKSAIEMMASLPSVVLGFLVAIVIAPFIAAVVPATLALFFALPFTVLAGAQLWQLLPAKLGLRLAGLPRFLAICAMLPLAVGLAWVGGPLVERLLFSGDFLHWLDKQHGSATPGWLLITFPAGGLAAFLLMGRFVAPWLRASSVQWSHARCAWFSLGQFAVGMLIASAVAWLLAAALNSAGFDPRDSVLGTYVQRNTLVVGVVMGFAVIPIIYTLSEDALNSVPSALRLASLGAGATPWQTAVRIVIPTAASGLFSAMMVGLGRAVGETMIVLMATGNTPVMSWNIFNGFRTLSANIAVELPEAVQNGTHYRTLFLAALSLFALTFVVNTVAEVVRQRFRKRAYQL